MGPGFWSIPGLDYLARSGGAGVFPNTGSGPFGILLWLGRMLWARQLPALVFACSFSFLICKPEIIILFARKKANV